MNNKKILLIGPLPPPNGGARVSFRLFYDYLKSNKVEFIHYDLPVRNQRNSSTPGNINFFETAKRVLLLLKDLHKSSALIFFGWKNLIKFGIFIIPIFHVFRKPCYLRFFGGHPFLELKKSIFFLRILSPLFLSLCKKIVVQTNIGKKEFPKFLQNKIAVIPGYRCINNLQITEKKIPSNKIRFAFMGELIKEKGINDLIEAFISITKNGNEQALELHIYGSDPNNVANSFYKFSDKIFYHGYLANNILRNELILNDILIFPSKLYSEGHPGAIVEALISNIPVICSNLPGPMEIVKDEINGLVFDLNKNGDLKLKMETIIFNPKLLEKLKNNTLESRKLFDKTKVLPKLAYELGIKGIKICVD
ncbi:MAG: glycosyltransferase family 4 protein [Halanaerobiales bacterium]|nr:glycosyltransferase family 4 protein [Halanaerobiales bacterium]